MKGVSCCSGVTAGCGWMMMKVMGGVDDCWRWVRQQWRWPQCSVVWCVAGWSGSMVTLVDKVVMSESGHWWVLLLVGGIGRKLQRRGLSGAMRVIRPNHHLISSISDCVKKPLIITSVLPPPPPKKTIVKRILYSDWRDAISWRNGIAGKTRKGRSRTCQVLKIDIK